MALHRLNMTPEIKSTASSHEWLARFATRLMRLRPELTQRMAIQRALLRYPDCLSMEPEFAARVYVRATCPDASTNLPLPAQAACVVRMMPTTGSAALPSEDQPKWSTERRAYATRAWR